RWTTYQSYETEQDPDRGSRRWSKGSCRARRSRRRAERIQETKLTVAAREGKTQEEPMAQTKTAVVQTRLDTELARRLLTQMALIRRFEEKAAEMYALGKIGGFLHLYIGQEAVAVGATSTVRVDDYAVSSYREHGHCLAKGSDPRRVMAELFGRMDGLSKGKGGS